MRGHGCTVAGKSIREAVYTAVYLEVNAELPMESRRLGNTAFLTAGEIEKINARLSRAKPGEGYDRAWEYWCGAPMSHRAAMRRGRGWAFSIRYTDN